MFTGNIKVLGARRATRGLRADVALACLRGFKDVFRRFLNNSVWKWGITAKTLSEKLAQYVWAQNIIIIGVSSPLFPIKVNFICIMVNQKKKGEKILFFRA